MEEAQVITSATDNFVVSTINIDEPHVPPTQEQHDLLLPTLFQYPTVALQIGVGYGALIFALEELGYAVHGIDTNLMLWQEAQSKVATPAKALMFENDIRNATLVDGRYGLIVADIGGAFRDPTMYDLKMFQRLSRMLSDTGILSFNFGVVPKIAMDCMRNADVVFPHVAVIPGTQVIVASKFEFELDPERMLRPEPDWLCATSNLYGLQDLP